MYDDSGLFRMVAMLAEKNPAEHGDAWERISLNRSDRDEWLLFGQGGPRSTIGRQYGPLAVHSIEVAPDEAHAILDAIAAGDPDLPAILDRFRPRLAARASASSW